MGYQFIGVFIAPCTLTTSEAENLFGGYAREISAPFRGIVLSFDEKLTGGGWKKEEMKLKVLQASKTIEKSKVVAINYSTWAGPIDYCYGFACQNGQLIAGSEREEEDEAGGEVLTGLLEIIGVQSPSRLFPPFERGYFPNT